MDGAFKYVAIYLIAFGLLMGFKIHEENKQKESMTTTHIPTTVSANPICKANKIQEYNHDTSGYETTHTHRTCKQYEDATGRIYINIEYQ